MPIFEYACDVCETKFEELIRSPSDAQSIQCPECEAPQVRKLFSTFGFTSSGSSTESGVSTGRASCASCTARSCARCR